VSDTDIHTEWLDPDSAYVARAPRPRGGVLVIHEGFGLNEHAQGVCRRLAAEGFTALAPDLYRRGPDRVAGYDEYPKAVAMLRSLPDEQVLSDLAAGLDRLGSLCGPAPVGVVGFRIGGRYALLVAARKPSRVAAAVSFYGSGIDAGAFSALWTIDALGEAPRIAAPLLLFFAGEDTTVTAAEVSRIEERLRDSGPPSEIVRYPGVRAGFIFEGRQTFAPAEAADAWHRTLRFLEAHVQRPGPCQ
jgi:carboxymethylenebutenolidase